MGDFKEQKESDENQSKSHRYTTITLPRVQVLIINPSCYHIAAVNSIVK